MLGPTIRDGWMALRRHSRAYRRSVGCNGPRWTALLTAVQVAVRPPPSDGRPEPAAATEAPNLPLTYLGRRGRGTLWNALDGCLTTLRKARTRGRGMQWRQQCGAGGPQATGLFATTPRFLGAAGTAGDERRVLGKWRLRQLTESGITRPPNAEDPAQLGRRAARGGSRTRVAGACQLA